MLYGIAAPSDSESGRRALGGLDHGLQLLERGAGQRLDDLRTGGRRELLTFAHPRTRFGLAVRGVLDEALTAPPSTSLTPRITRVAGTDRGLPTIPGR